MLQPSKKKYLPALSKLLLEKLFIIIFWPNEIRYLKKWYHGSDCTWLLRRLFTLNITLRILHCIFSWNSRNAGEDRFLCLFRQRQFVCDSSWCRFTCSTTEQKRSTSKWELFTSASSTSPTETDSKSRNIVVYSVHALSVDSDVHSSQN